MIHHFDGLHWLPGASRADGSRPFPVHVGPGMCFNDVTGRVGATADEVAENLPDLLMKQGALARLLRTPFDWHGLMGRIQKAVGAPKKLTVPMVDVVVHPDETLEVLPYPGWNAQLLQDAGRLAFALVRANGQMDFIRRQPWFQDGACQVELHVMTQWGRAIDELRFHKDTRGEELFSNLVFRSDRRMPATEWSVDLEKMPADKRAQLEQAWPAMLVDAIEMTREHLVAPEGAMFCIEGGVLEPDSFVSWVDELVWHSTPSLEHRPRYTLDDAARVLADPAYSLRTYDILVQIARLKGGSFARYLAANEVPVESLSGDLVGRLFEWAHTDPDCFHLRQDWLDDARAMDWRDRPRDTATGLAMVQVKTEAREGGQLLQPTGLEGRPRRNSHRLQELRALPGGHEPRDMLAVFVRVRPAR